MDPATKAYTEAKSLEEIRKLDKMDHDTRPDNRIRLAKIQVLELELELEHIQTCIIKARRALHEILQAYE
jgi:hypothetical protein